MFLEEAMKKILLVISSVLILVFLQYGSSQFSELGSIITPSGNIFCRVWGAADPATLPKTFDPKLNTTDLICEVKEITAKIPAKPKDCQFDYGYRFVVSERGQARRACYSDVLYSPSMKRLEYGQTRKIAGFTCDLTKARLRCVNLDKRGFELSKAIQKFF
jgi:hypothetical protein